MDMRMVGECLPPCMQDGNEAKLTADMLGIGGDGLQRLGHGVEQNGVDQRLVLVSYRRDLGWQGEHDVEIWHRQQIGLTGGQPLIARTTLAFGAMPVAARIISNTGVGAVGAGLDMATECRGPAQLDRRHHAALDAPEMSVMGSTIARPMAAEDIRHLKRGMHHPATHIGGITSRLKRSNGLCVAAIVVVATWV